MSIALPISHPAEIVVAPKPIGEFRPFWFIAIWAVVMLLVSVFGHPDTATGPHDPLQLLMIY
jgi:hypothetical protein